MFVFRTGMTYLQSSSAPRVEPARVHQKGPRVVGRNQRIVVAEGDAPALVEVSTAALRAAV